MTDTGIGNRKINPMLLTLPAPKKKSKIITADEAVRKIKSGDTMATEGFCGACFSEDMIIALEKRFLQTGEPRDLTFVYAAGQGDGKDRGLNHIGHEGLVRMIIGGHIGLVPTLQNLVRKNLIFAYNMPQGVVAHLFRDIAAKKPGTITRVGLGTFIDPRIDGGKLNEKTFREGKDIVELIQLAGEEYLFYKAFPINVALIRGTTADTDGNITMEKEPLILESLAIASAAKNSGGIVIAQVERIAERKTLNCRDVKVPGILVDYIVVANPANHCQTFAEAYNPSLSGEIKIPLQSILPLEMGPRKIIARRAAFELLPNSIVNLGIGMPEGVANVANEEKITDYLTLTTEPGTIGGVPHGGLNFGTASNMDCLVDQPAQFDFYDGGGLDTAFLGAAEVDEEGNVNVSKFGPRFVGPGGFINISQNAKEVIFLGTFTAGNLQISIIDGRLHVIREGNERKFIKQVQQKTFSGYYAAKNKKRVIYVTERCVFKLTEEGLELTEIAPGIDLKKDILDQMGFAPVVKGEPKLMDARIFMEEPMNLIDEMVTVPIEERLTYFAAENIFYVNFERLHIKSSGDIQKIKRTIDAVLGEPQKKVDVIVNYDDFIIRPDLADEYASMLKEVEKYYESVTRYTTSAFMKMKLGDELEKDASSGA